MKIFLRSVLLALLSLLPLAGCGIPEEDNLPEQPAPAEMTANNDEANQQVDALFAGFVEADSPGGAVMVLHNGAVVYQAAYGLANLETGEALTADHIFHIASTGKPMTATAILMLVAQGKLDLDEPVGRYVPEVAHFGDAFTVRRLLTHTAGLGDYEDIEDALFARADQPTNADLVAVLSEMDTPPLPVGGQFEYSNAGYDLLAVVIERVSGMKFSEFMTRNIFTPLGMKDTFSLPNPQRRAGARVAMSYTAENGTPEAYPEDDLDNLYGSGSIYTTLADFARYDEALYDGNQLLPPEVLAQAFEPSELDAEYGMGWELGEWQGLPYVGHTGAWLGFSSDYVRFPEQHFSVIVLLNRDYGYPDEPRIALQIAAFYLER